MQCSHMVGKEASQAEQPQRVVAPWNPELQITVVAIFIVKMVQSAVYLLVRCHFRVFGHAIQQSALNDGFRVYEPVCLCHYLSVHAARLFLV